MQLYLLVFLLIALVIILQLMKYNIPKIAWSYWDNNTPPIITRIIEERKRTMPDWNIRLLTEDTIRNYIDLSSVPKGYYNLKPQHKADWIRLKLLEKYGGLWLDSSIIVNNGDAINEMYEDAIRTKAELVTFTLDKPTAEEYIENWFIMAPMRSHVIEDWLAEYEKAISMGFPEYRRYVMMKEPTISEDIYSKKHESVYLTQHACIQVVLKRRNLLRAKSRVLLYPADRNMFKVQIGCDWKHKCIIDNISNNPQVNKLPFIKLRGGEKTIDYEKYFARSRTNTV